MSLMASALRVAGDICGLEFLDETCLRAYGPEQILNRMLSMKTYMSTLPSQASRDQAAQGHPPQLRAVQHIGEGMCGIVFALVGTEYVIKIAKPGKMDTLWSDCCTHKQVEESFDSLAINMRPDINIPRFGEWVHSSNKIWWEKHAFPSDITPGFGLLSTRIFPLPEPVREAVFNLFAPKQLRRNADEELDQPKNKNCLVRIYLGRREKRQPSESFKLRNFDLMINEIEFLRLDADKFARIMADTLAMLHWKVGIDANDVEFVLGSRPLVRQAATAAEYIAAGPDGARFLSQTLDFQRRSVGVWLLDFNQCRRFTHDQAGLKQLIDSFEWNDPYYPRPSNKDPKDQKLWAAFKQQYLERSSEYPKNNGFAEAFVKGVENRFSKRGASLFG